MYKARGEFTPRQWSAPELQKRRLRRLGSAIGLALIGYLAISLFLPLLMRAVLALTSGRGALGGLWDSPGPVAEELMNTGSYLAALGLPFLVLGSFGGLPTSTFFGAGKGDAAHRMACVGLCLGAASVGNILSDLLSRVTGALGFIPYYQPQGFGRGLAADFIWALTATVLAAFLEEFAFRGVLLNLLRPFGDGFAITASALLFALCHPSGAQTIPAFVTGLVMGYVVVSTGSIWVAVLAHFLYNTIAVGMSWLLLWLSPDVAGMAVALFTALMLVAGIFSAILLSREPDSFRLGGGNCSLTTGQKAAALALSPPLLAVGIAMLWIIISSYVPTYMNGFN